MPPAWRARRVRAVTQAALVSALLVGAGLRACALLAPALGVELDAAYPQHAVLSIAERTWKPFALVHGSLLSELLRALFLPWYVAGHLLGDPDRTRALKALGYVR